jgi:hypothetical protein
MRVMVLVLTEKNISRIAYETGRTELELLRMLKKADAIGHRCIFSKYVNETVWTYGLVRSSIPKSRLVKAA